MGQQNAPIEQNELRGIYLSGNPAARPQGTAQVCENFRVMPGNWLRLCGGRKGRYNIAPATVQQIWPFRILDLPGASNCLIQKKISPTSIKWTWLSLLTYVPDPSDIEEITLTYDGSFAASNPAAVCNLPDRPIFYNGLGTRVPQGSFPPFSSYFNGVLRYFGLDCYAPNGNPTATWSATPGYNTVQTSVEIWVGVYNSATEHYSNAIYVGTITTGTLGTINVGSLQKILWAAHGVSEQAELAYVFYATIDGGQVPYLIMNTALSGPHSVPISSTTASLSIASGTDNGWVLDLTKEAPTSNHPPRPMKSVCYQNGRVYGAPLSGGYGDAVWQRTIGGSLSLADFTYQQLTRELAGVAWSAASGDAGASERLGDPLQSWPLTNFAATPNGDVPIAVWPADDAMSVLVFTSRAVFMLTEASDGLHQYSTVSEIHGLSNPATLRTTRYGVIWVDQRDQIVVLPPGGTVQVLSGNYQPLMGTPICADYLYDSVNDIDQYRVWLAGGTCVIHDFGLGHQAYTATGQNYTAARSVTDTSGHQHHIVANTAFYTQEGQPEDGLIPVANELFTTGQAKTTWYPTATYIRNWSDMGDANARKDLRRVDLIGDGDQSETSWQGDFDASTWMDAVKSKSPQSPTDQMWWYQIGAGAKFWHKLRFILTPDGTVAPANHSRPELEGDLSLNFYGAILRLLLHFDRAENR